MRGAWDEAVAAWKDVAEKDPKAHAALYDMALAKVLKGEDEAAQTLLAQAYALDANMSYGAMLTEVQARLAMRKQILPSGEVSSPAKPAEK